MTLDFSVVVLLRHGKHQWYSIMIHDSTMIKLLLKHFGGNRFSSWDMTLMEDLAARLQHVQSSVQCRHIHSASLADLCSLAGAHCKF